MTKNVDFQIGKRAYRFKWQVGFGIFCTVFFVLCCVLSVWQLHRYQFKNNLLVSYQKQLQSKPQSLQDVLHKEGEKQFRVVAATGEYLPELTVLVQNRVYNGRIGFEVFTPLRVAGEKTLFLVDRGWVDKMENATPPATSKQNVFGYLKENNEYQFILGKNIVSPKHPIVLQKLDLIDIAAITKQDFYPLLLRLDPHADNGFVREWTITAVTPERHLGYAAQWFIFALIILIAYFCFCIERVENANEKK